jgi:hypothetical protein
MKKYLWYAATWKGPRNTGVGGIAVGLRAVSIIHVDQTGNDAMRLLSSNQPLMVHTFCLKLTTLSTVSVEP